MSKKKSHSKNLSQQAIDLINTYNSYKQRNLASINLDKKRSLYSPRVSIQEEEFEESPMLLKRNCARTEHININIYETQYFDLDEELQQDVKELKHTLHQRIIQLKGLIHDRKNLENKENHAHSQNQRKRPAPLSARTKRV